MSEEETEGEEESTGLIDWQRIDWSSWLTVLFLVAVVTWFVTGGIRTGVTVYYGSPVGFATESEQFGNFVVRLVQAVSVIELIAFRAWIAAGAVIGLLWLRNRSN